MACAHATGWDFVVGLRNKLDSSIFKRVLLLKGYIYQVVLRFICWYSSLGFLILLYYNALSFYYDTLWQLEIKWNCFWEIFLFQNVIQFSPIWTQTQLGKIFFFVCVVHNWRKEISTSITKRKSRGLSYRNR